jgi:hypothetical protein
VTGKIDCREHMPEQTANADVWATRISQKVALKTSL